MSSRRIFGIDPGLLRTGWGVVDIGNNGTARYVDCGVIHPDPKLLMESRLVFIFDEIQSLLLSLQPTCVAMEEVFININPRSSEKLIMARTASLMAVSKSGLQIHSYRPNEIKKDVTGSGHASKELVSSMVKMILKASIDSDNRTRTADSTDALAVALCCAFSLSSRISSSA
jgi:crossover junction endodeoxyribonuclease RuvC